MSIPTQTADLSVETRPTQGDAQVMLQLAQLAQTPAFDRGMGLLWKHKKDGGPLSYEQFEADYPPDSPDAGAIMAVLKWYETVGTLVKQGLLDRGLVYDWLWVSGTWHLCAPIALGQRAEMGVPQMWENFEALADGQTD